MAADTKKLKNIEYDLQEWDMDFKDPFSLEDDELTASCHPAVASTTVSEDHLAVETGGLVQNVSTVVTRSLQAVTIDHDSGTTAVELPKCKENSQHHEFDMESNIRSGTAVLANGSIRTQHVGESFTFCGNKLSHNNNTELSNSKATSASFEEQRPIPVMLSSTKRFCASDEIHSSHPTGTKHDSAYVQMPPPSVVLNNPPVHFAPPAYPPTACNIPAWPTVSLSLPVYNSGKGLPLRPMVPYNNGIPYSTYLPHSANISALYNQSATPVAAGTGASHWPAANMNLQDILTKPPPPLPVVSHAAALGQPASDLGVLPTVPVPHLRNGLPLHRLTFAAVPPFAPPYRNRLLFGNSPRSVLPQQGQPVSVMKPRLPVVSTVSSAGQVLPHCSSSGTQESKLQSNNTNVTASSSSALLKSNNNNDNNPEHTKHLLSKQNDKTEQSRPTLPVTDVSTLATAGLLISDSCPPLTSSVSASEQTVTQTTATSSLNIPPTHVKFSSTFAQLDPRIHNGHRQNSSAAVQSRSSMTPATAASSDFVVPVPPPLPSLEELTAGCAEDPQKDDRTAIVSSSVQSTTSSTPTASSAQPDKVIPCNFG